MKFKYYILLFILAISCQKKNDNLYTFYYWKTTLHLTKLEKETLANATNPHLYVRMFDVDKVNGKLAPVAIAAIDTTFKTDKKMVPVIFITNTTFVNITSEEIENLAHNISTLINKKFEEFQLSPTDEIQIDCDWTVGTKKDYFDFLQKLNKVTHKKITSTLRLHQVKDRDKMGIPPVDKVYLMCYSTSSPLENSNKNSILDVDVLKSYLRTLDSYPIKQIDVALPIYSWGIVTNHFGKHKLINALSLDDLTHKDFKKISANEALVEKDGFHFGHYLNKGFKIKVEQIEDSSLAEVEQFLCKKIKNYSQRI